MKLSIIIPAFNEVENIPQLHSELTDQIRMVDRIEDYEIIFVDDHSSDNTMDILRRLGDPHVRGIRLSRRSGSHIALRAGLHAAGGDAVLCLSADGQDDPGVLKEMISQWFSGVQVIWALRKGRQDEPGYFRFAANCFYHFLKGIGVQTDSEVDLNRADFFLLDRVVVDALNTCLEQKTSVFGLLNWMGFKTGAVEYERRPRRAGRSKWSLSARINLAWDWIAGFSGAPLRLVLWVGLLVFVMGLVFQGAVVCGIAPQLSMGNNPGVMALLLITGGVQMLALGIIGAYVWRGVEDARGRPLYFIEEKI